LKTVLRAKVISRAGRPVRQAAQRETRDMLA
jgi:hypothetical protein